MLALRTTRKAGSVILLLGSKSQWRAVVHNRHNVCNIRNKSTCEHIGFIGLGNMGAHMAANLAKKGHKVHVFDQSHQQAELVRKHAGVDAAKHIFIKNSLTELTETEELFVMVTMLPSSPQVVQVYGIDASGAGLIQSARSNTLFIDCTTGDPEVAKQVAAAASAHQTAYVDAPVSGGVLAARDAGLTFMVGGSNEAVSRATPVLEKMGKRIFHCGAVGTGLAAKICNNMLLAISMIGTSEAMELGKRLGLDPNILAKVLNSSSGRCWSSELYNPVPGILPDVPASRNYEGGFSSALMTKDLGLAQNAATHVHLSTALGSLAHQIYRLMCQQGYSAKDFSSIYQFISKAP